MSNFVSLVYLTLIIWDDCLDFCDGHTHLMACLSILTFSDAYEEGHISPQKELLKRVLLEGISSIWHHLVDSSLSEACFHSCDCCELSLHMSHCAFVLDGQHEGYNVEFVG